jgi:RNA polymerase sigma-70 factor (ECF subfamily)
VQLRFHIKRCRANIEESCKIIYYSFFHVAKEYCERYALNEEEQVDIADLGFLKLFKYIHHFDISSKHIAKDFGVWLKKMMLYAVVAHYRRQLKPFDFLFIERRKLKQVISRSVKWNVHIKEENIKSIIVQLPASRRLVLFLLCMKEFSLREVAHCLEMPAETLDHIYSKILSTFIFDTNVPVIGASEDS